MKKKARRDEGTKGRRHGEYDPRRAQGVTPQRGYLLLELVISIALLMMGLTFIGAQVQKATESAYGGEDLTRLLMLAESKIAELDTGLVVFEEDVDDEVEGDFTLRFPNYGWRMRAQDTTTPGLRSISLEILHWKRESPDEEFDFENSSVVYRTYTMRAVPPVLDATTDLGLNEEKIQELSETLPTEFFDPPYFDPAVLSQMDMEQLIELLPSLVSLFGDNAAAMLASLPPEFRAMLDLSGVNIGSQAAGGSADGSQTRPSGPAGADALTDEELRDFGMTREEFEQLNGGGNQPANGDGGRSGAPAGGGGRQGNQSGGVKPGSQPAGGQTGVQPSGGRPGGQRQPPVKGGRGGGKGG